MHLTRHLIKIRCLYTANLNLPFPTVEVNTAKVSRFCVLVLFVVEAPILTLFLQYPTIHRLPMDTGSLLMATLTNSRPSTDQRKCMSLPLWPGHKGCRYQGLRAQVFRACLREILLETAREALSDCTTPRIRLASGLLCRISV